MHEALLGETQRQVAVGVAPVVVDLDVPRAVHRLEPELPSLDLLGQEHLVAVVVPVAGALPELGAVEDRRPHLLVTAARVELAPEAAELVEEHHSARMPERRAGRGVAEVEEVELAPEPAMVAPARLLDALEMRVEVGLLEERRAVDAREHRAARVAAPVGARERRQLEGPDRLRRLQVRATAEVGEAVLLVERDLLARGERLGDLDLVGLAIGAEARDSVLARRLDALVGVRPALQDRAHLVLDAGQVALTRRFREIEVVVETVLDRGPDRDLRAGPEVLDGLGHEVRGRVAQHRQRVVVADAQNAQVRAIGQRQAEIAQLAVDLDGGRGVGQPRSDRARGVEPAGAGRELELVAVGEDGPGHTSECRYLRDPA